MDRQPLTGHSNFRVSLVATPEGFYVTKEAGRREKERLRRQSKKQELFAQLLRQDETMRHLFEIPSVIKDTEDEDRYEFLMKYYRGDTILQLIESGDIAYLELVVTRTTHFVRWCLQRSTRETVPAATLVQKVRSISEGATDARLRRLTTVLSAWLEDRGSLSVPVGHCHGDLTFANIIFSHKVVFIDFLDTFLETPLQDVAKLLQEVNLEWSFLMQPNLVDKTKVAIGYNHLRRLLSEEFTRLFAEFGIDDDTARAFYVITLLRLIPYAHDEHIYERALAEAQTQLEVLCNQ